MRSTFFILACGLFLLNTVLAADLRTTKAGDVIHVDITDIHPTQATIGYREVDYKINQYRRDRKKLFADYCESAGAQDVARFDLQSTLTDAQSFTCKDTIGTNKQDMKTVVIAPDNALYLTDGHHTLSAFRALYPASLQVPVQVTHDYRNLPDMAAFWGTMEKANLVLLRNGDHTERPETLPKQVGKQAMQDDAYRSIIYFARDIAYRKPVNAPPFYEFYWANWVKAHVDIRQYDLHSKKDYGNLIKATAKRIAGIDKAEVIATIDTKPYTAGDMGALPSFNKKHFNKLVSSTGKLAYAFAE